MRNLTGNHQMRLYDNLTTGGVAINFAPSLAITQQGQKLLRVLCLIYLDSWRYSLSLWDVDTATLQRLLLVLPIQVVLDFKVLRIPN